MDFYHAVWANPEHTAIDMELDHPDFGIIPFTATEDDIEALGREMFNKAKDGPVGEYVEPVPDIEQQRATMTCSPLQGQLALGQVRWKVVEDFLAHPDTPWAMTVTIKQANVWRRNSQTIDELKWLLDLTDEETDELFIQAAQIEV